MTQPKFMIHSFSRYPAIYFRVPKVASTSLLISFRKVDTVEKVEEYNTLQFKFAFVRNPFDRLTSCYRHVIRNGTPEVLSGCPGMNREMSFEKFVDAISEIKDVSKMDMHFRPQYTFFPEKPDYICKFEDLNEDYLKVCEKIGFRAPDLPWTNSTDKTIFKDYYNEIIIEKVITIYKKDFELFGYSKRGEK